MRPILTRLVVALIATSLCLAVGCRTEDNPESRIERTIIYDGEKVLGPDLGVAKIRVWRIFKYSTSAWDAEDIRKNRFEITLSGQQQYFEWSDFAAETVSFADLDGDQNQELLLHEDSLRVRVVSLAGGKIQFKQKQDELACGKWSLDPRKIPGVGTGFLCGKGFPEDANETVPVPRVLVWSRAAGFVDVTNDAKKFLRTDIFPALIKEFSAEGDTKRVRLLELAIEQYR